MKYTYSALLVPAEEGCYTARITSIPGLVVEGTSYFDALLNLEQALAEAIDDYRARHEALPLDDKCRNASLPYGARIERITLEDSRVRRLIEEYRDEADDWY